jgi:hypothetical protein
VPTTVREYGWYRNPGSTSVLCQPSRENSPSTVMPTPAGTPAGGDGSYGRLGSVAEVATENRTSNFS